MKLHEQVKTFKKQNKEIQEDIQNMLSYVSGPKFFNDTTIQVWEVQKMLLQIRSKLTEVIE